MSEVYTILLLENDYYTSKEIYGTYSNKKAVKKAVKEMVSKNSTINIIYRNSTNEEHTKYFSHEPETLIARTLSTVRLKSKYNKSSNIDASYTIYFYKTEVID